MGCGSSVPATVSPTEEKPAKPVQPAPSASTESAAPAKPVGQKERRYSAINDFTLKYDKGEKLGSGGFGDVFTCTEKSSGRIFALKTISKLKFAGEEERMNMLTEVDLHRRCNGHGSVVQLYDSFEDKANFYILVERCTGGELMDSIINHQSFSEAVAARYFREMAEAVKHIHSKLVIHRDIKPENFLLASPEPNSPLKITDFGLACAIETPESIINDACGSAYYIAPETFGRAMSRASDVWSLGVVLYLLLSGNVPFGGDAESETAVYHSIQRDPLKFGDAFAKISAAARELLSGLLEKDPHKRYTLEQALSHPWVTGEAAPTTVLDKSLLASLGSFNAKNKFKKAAIRMVASTLTASDVANLRAAFNAIDVDGSGTITYKEMAQALKAHFHITDDAVIASMVRNLDENGDGKLSYNEWLQAVLETRMIHHQQAIWSAFNAFDLNGDGIITVDEMLSVLKGMTPEEARANVAEYDIDKDGVIRYDEFLKMMLGKNLRVKIAAVPAPAPAAPAGDAAAAPAPASA